MRMARTQPQSSSTKKSVDLSRKLQFEKLKMTESKKETNLLIRGGFSKDEIERIEKEFQEFSIEKVIRTVVWLKKNNKFFKNIDVFEVAKIICNSLRVERNVERNVFKGYAELITRAEEDGRGSLHSHLIVFSEGGIANGDSGEHSQNIDDHNL